MLEAVQTIDSQRKSILDLQVALFVCYFILVIKNEILYHTIFFFILQFCEQVKVIA